jgi:hypothetical protein
MAMARAFFWRPNAMASSVAVSQACSAVTTSMLAGNVADSVADGEVKERHARKSQSLSQLARALHEPGARFDAIDVPAPQRPEEQVVQNKAQVGFACAMVARVGACPSADIPATGVR